MTPRPVSTPATHLVQPFAAPNEMLAALVLALGEICGSGLSLMRSEAEANEGPGESRCSPSRDFAVRRLATLGIPVEAFPWPHRRLADALGIDQRVAEALVAVACLPRIPPSDFQSSRREELRARRRAGHMHGDWAGRADEEEDDHGRRRGGSSDAFEAGDPVAAGRCLFEWDDEACEQVTRSLAIDGSRRLEGLVAFKPIGPRRPGIDPRGGEHRLLPLSPLRRFVDGDGNVARGLSLFESDGARAGSRMSASTAARIVRGLATTARLRSVLDGQHLPVGHLRDRSGWLRLLIHPECDSEGLCRALAALVGRRVLLARDAGAHLGAGGSGLFAEARLRGAVVVLDRTQPTRARHACDRDFEFFGMDDSPHRQDEPDGSQFADVPAISLRRGQSDDPTGRRVGEITLEPPCESERRLWWVSALDAVGAGPVGDGVLQRLVALALHPEQMMALTFVWLEASAADGIEADPEALALLAQEVSAGSDDDEIPQTRLDQVALSPELTDRLAFALSACREGAGLLKQLEGSLHGGYGHAVVLLLSGGPGLGKTLVAEGLAGELRLPLTRCSGADIRGMYYGQSESRIRALFRKPGRRVVFLDEADGLLRARRDDPSSHIDSRLVNVLLEEIERTEHVVVLATNRPDSLDPALARRILFDLRFELPGPRERRAIWAGHLPASFPGASDVDLDAVKYLPLTGGGIKNASWRALLRAKRDGVPLSTTLVLEEAACEPFAAEVVTSPVGRNLPEG